MNSLEYMKECSFHTNCIIGNVYCGESDEYGLGYHEVHVSMNELRLVKMDGERK